MSESINAKATRLGVPMVIPIDNATRHRNCEAHEAQLHELDEANGLAFYRGVCPGRHAYKIQVQIEKLKLDLNGNQLTIGGSDNEPSTQLREY